MTHQDKKPTNIQPPSRKLNVGSDGQEAGWLNVDLYNDCDVKADIRQLPFADNTFSNILASHVLEHIPLADVPMAMQEMLRVCRSGGTIIIRVPDNVYDSELARKVSVQGSDHKPGYRHEWESSEALLLQLGQQAGLQLRRIDDLPDWPQAHWPFRQIVLRGTKPVPD